MQPAKLLYVDALRGWAILAVVMVHVGTVETSAVLGAVIGQGARGVQLFYVVSAFTLFLSFQNRTGSERMPVRNFFVRRFFRIAPMYYLGICYYLWQDGLGARNWLGDATYISAPNIVSNFLFLHGFNPYWVTSLVPGGWSIAVEMTFYVLLPFLFLRIKNMDRAFNFFLFAIVLRWVLHAMLTRVHPIGSQPLWDAYLFFYFPSQLPVFALGILLYFVLYRPRDITTVSLLLFTGLVLLQLCAGFVFFPEHVLFGVAFLCLALALSRRRFVLLVNPVINHIGRVSFSMYLVHFAVVYWLTRWNMMDYADNEILNYAIRFVTVAGVGVVISSVLYRWVELPFQRLGAKWIRRREKNDGPV